MPLRGHTGHVLEPQVFGDCQALLREPDETSAMIAGPTAERTEIKALTASDDMYLVLLAAT